MYELLTGKELQEKYHILVRQIEEMLPLYNELTEENFKILKKNYKSKSVLWYFTWDEIKILPKTLDGYFKLLDPKENNIKLYDYNEYKNSNFLEKSSQGNEVWTDSKSILVELNSMYSKNIMIR